MKLFCDIVKAQPGTSSGHVTTALGNESYRFGRNRSQPVRDRKRRDFNQVIAEQGRATEAKWPDVGLDEEEEGDIVRQQKSWNIPLDVKKVDPDQQLIFGWASVVEKDGVPVIDKQRDIIPIPELENAAYEFVLYSRDHGDMHARRNVGKLVESMVFTKDKQKALDIDLKQVGWWVGFKISDAELWAAHKRGERPEFSIGGAAFPVEIELE